MSTTETAEYDYVMIPEAYMPAFHWDGTEDSTNALAELVGDDEGPYGRCDFFDIELDNGGTVHVLPGDYVIRNYDGRWSVIEESTFEEYFELMRGRS